MYSPLNNKKNIPIRLKKRESFFVKHNLAQGKKKLQDKEVHKSRLYLTARISLAPVRKLVSASPKARPRAKSGITPREDRQTIFLQGLNSFLLGLSFRLYDFIKLFVETS